jgi:hypothetical protein
MSRASPTTLGVALGLVGVTGYAAALAIGMDRTSYDMWGAMVVAPCLLLVSWPLLAAAFRHEEDGWVRRLIGLAFAVKVVGALARWAVAFVLYGGIADAAGYDRHGAAIAAQLRAGVLTVDAGPQFVGTGFLRLVTGVVYAVTGPTLLGGYLVFAWMGFWGLYFFYRAFRVALPGANHRRYALLVFLLPSMIFWPSGIGKEAWMCLCLGVATYGAARLVTGSGRAALPLTLGLIGAAMVRPHMAALLFVATVAGFLFRRDAQRTVLTPVARTATLVVLAVAGLWIANQAAEFFHVDSLSVQSVDTVLNDTGKRELGGGSDFQAHPVRSPADLPVAVVTVLFRPFPWEAGNVQALATAVEGTVLLLLAVASWGRWTNLGRFRAGRPYAVLCVAYLLMFVYAFSTFNNFGLLARQRVLVYPFLLALLCLPTRRELRRREAVHHPPASRKALEP